MGGAQFTFKPSPRSFRNSAPKCPLCSTSVYAAEQVLGPNGTPYHKACLKCVVCSKVLDPFNLREHGQDPFCKLCHAKAFGTKGVGYGNAVVGQYLSTTSPPACPAPLPVHQAVSHDCPTIHLDSARNVAPKKLTSQDHSPHARPQETRPGENGPLRGGLRLETDGFTPPVKPLPSPTISTTPQAHALHSLPITTGLLNPNSPDSLSTEKSLKSELVAQEDENFFEAPSLARFQITVKSRSDVTKGRDLHCASSSNDELLAPVTDSLSLHDTVSLQPQQRSWLCEGPKSPVGPSGVGGLRVLTVSQLPLLGPSRPQACSPVKPNAYQVSPKAVGSPSYGVSWSRPVGNSPSARGHRLGLGTDGPQLCPRCSQTVYHAEQVLAVGKKWHKRCLRCERCSKALDASMNEWKGTPYCTKCYDSQFGIAAQGFVLGAGFATR